MILALIIGLVFTTGLCVWFACLIITSEKTVKYWRDLYFQTRDEAQELFEQNIELRAQSKQK